MHIYIYIINYHYISAIYVPYHLSHFSWRTLPRTSDGSHFVRFQRVRGATGAAGASGASSTKNPVGVLVMHSTCMHYISG